MSAAITTLEAPTPIPRPPRLALSFLMALLWFTSPVQAAPAPIVFDFEDGLQGWELSGSAQRVQTQILGGEWAIFGDGILLADITLTTDPIRIRSISVELFIVDGEAENLLLRTEGSLFVIFEPFQVIQPGNPSVLSVEFGANGRIIEEVMIRWRDLPIRPGPHEVVGFIDNITFRPVPEPATLVLFGSALIGLAGLRRCR